MTAKCVRHVLGTLQHSRGALPVLVHPKHALSFIMPRSRESPNVSLGVVGEHTSRLPDVILLPSTHDSLAAQNGPPESESRRGRLAKVRGTHCCHIPCPNATRRLHTYRTTLVKPRERHPTIICIHSGSAAYKTLQVPNNQLFTSKVEVYATCQRLRILSSFDAAQSRTA